MESGRVATSKVPWRPGALIIPYNGKTATIPSSVFVAEGAHIIGDVEIGEDSSIWFNVVMRGDINFIKIGEKTNIQDNCVLHVTHNNPVRIGSSVTVGHGAVIHGATVGDFCLIGMGACVLDSARVGTFSLVAAGALVLEGFEVPSGSLVAGVPAKIRRNLTPQERENIIQSAQNYVKYAQPYRAK
jgi:carbonic anhydrase/acetyltransferase-like protein (isoleucine patch superfamily)